ncbi:unnamed protein product [Paramecium octaurelia]|uniref:Uncharacterized protein n=1 Tax=Paramecium octaurelia TaxID=43137 RepID=A0A8S1VVP0_PAROT|nr:unnamed protein product [Paramecium octaurelia]
MEEKEIDAQWNQLLKTTVEMFGFEFKQEYLSKSFNRLYSDYKMFTQKRNYSHFALWLFGFYVLNFLQSLQDKNISDIPKIIEQLIFCPILIMVLISTKPFLYRSFESELLYFLQNTIVIIVGIMFPRPQQTEYGIFIEFFIYQANLESLPFKIIYIIVSQLIQKEIKSFMDLVIFVILLALAVYQEIHRYTSYISDYEQVEKHRKQEKQILEFILEAQNYDERERIYRKLKKQLKAKNSKKISLDTVLDYIF